MTSFRLFQIEEFANDKFRFDENDRKFSKWLENTMGKGEIARYEQFLLSHSVFKRLVPHTRKDQGLFEKGLVKQEQIYIHKPRKKRVMNPKPYLEKWELNPLLHKYSF